ncbi:hypothetical protein K1T71_001188 [Dendrolimus kikuchii]|uniref:Uncharacterized protein n=1 Tax=Dendrolimus kikuchii TaxID=765133 RepID=A0ACC1DH45_9NEOP|nr:hypothetical protein K1T71_001188 [Dendrolimus kikuchii]
MIAKITALLSLLAVARAGVIHGAGLGYSGLDYASGLGYGYGSLGYGYGVPAYGYTAPVVSYTPAVSSVSRYDVHSTPIVKSYVAPIAGYSYASPYYSSLYDGHGYGYGTYGYGSKYLW